MSSHTRPLSLNGSIDRLKGQQQECARLLAECIQVRDSHPQFSQRLDEIIANVEAVMVQNSFALAQLEATARFGQHTDKLKQRIEAAG